MTKGCDARLSDCDAEPAVAGLARAATFVEFEPQTRIEGEIQQTPSDYPVTEFFRVVRGDAAGRTDARQITLFDSVGFAIEDFSALLADPDEPRFGILQRTKADS
jgi:ornithine cyclodeaminase